MSTQYTGYIKSFGNAGFIAGVNELNGMVEQANSPQGAIEKLITALRIRYAYIEKVSIDTINFIAVPKDSEEINPSHKQQKEVNLVLQ